MAIIGQELARNRAKNPRGVAASFAPQEVRRNLAANSSVEVNATGYAAIPGAGGTCAGARTAGSIYHGSYHYRVTWSVATTAAGGGLEYNQSGSGVQVTAGLPYAVSWFVQPSKNQRLRLQIRWYNGAAFLSTTDSAVVNAVAGSGFLTRLQAVGVAPASATHMRVQVISSTGTGFAQWASGDWLAADGLLIEQTTRVQDWFDSTWSYSGTRSVDGVTGAHILSETVATVRTNLVYNPSAETSVGNCVSWGTGGASATSDTTRAVAGTRSFKIVRAGTNGSAGYGWQLALETAAPGDVFTFSAYLWSAAARTIETYAAYTYLDRSTTDTAVDLGATEPPDVRVEKTLAAGQWTRVDFTVTIPAGSMPVQSVACGFMFDDFAVDPLWVDAVMVERGPNLNPYFDGDTPTDGVLSYEWGTLNGTPNPHGFFSRQVAPRPSSYWSEGGAEFYRAGATGIGVTGSVLEASAAGSGVYAFAASDFVGQAATAVARLQAVDACTLELNRDAATDVTLAAGQIVEIRSPIASADVGVVGQEHGWFIPMVEQKDAAPKRWTVLGLGVYEPTYTGPYFDGSTPAPDTDSRYVWVGLADDSESVLEFLPAPVLTATPDQATRSVELLAEGIASVELISVRRITPGYEPKLVRPARAAVAVGGTLFAFDHEPPLGLTSQYQVMAHYPDGATSAWSDPISVSIGCDSNEVWIKDPGQPLRSTRLVLRGLSGRTRQDRSERHDVRGRKYRVVISDVRSGAEETVILGTRTHAEKDQLDLLLDTGQVLLLQVPPDWGRKDAFQAFGRSQEVRLRQYGPVQHRDWQIDIEEVEEPTGDRTGLPDNSYAQVLASFATYADLLAARPTYLSVLAGTAEIR